MHGTSGTVAIRFENIARVTGGDPGMMKEMLDLFLRLAPQSLTRMKEELGKQDWQALAREAHKFKPSTMYIGLVEVYANLELVEGMARNNPDTGALSRLIAEIDAVCDSAFPDLWLLRDGLA